jgi:bifunctional DNase/RNase
MRRRTTHVEMRVDQLTTDPLTNMPILILKDETGAQALPIWIGLIEASAIATELEKIALDRPMTHDLLKNVITECGGRVDRVEITDVKDNTFFATIFVTRPGKRCLRLDARPSDAIALALRSDARICVASRVIERTRHVDLGMPSGEPDGVEGARLRDLLEGLSDDEFGKWKM